MINKHLMSTLSWFKAGAGCQVDGSVVTHVGGSGSSLNCVYGSQEVSSGKHEWTVRVISDGSIMIGITSNTKCLESRCYQREDTYCYVYYSNNGFKYDKSGSTNYAEAYGDSDIITVLVDLDKDTIVFAKNGVDLGIAYSNVQPHQKYRLTLCLGYTGEKVEMISYKNISSEERKEESKCEEMNDMSYIEQCIQLMAKQCEYMKENYTKEKMESLNKQQLNNTSTDLSTLSSNMTRLNDQFIKCQEQLLRSRDALKEYTALDTQDIENE